jgi:hypothetical protein
MSTCHHDWDPIKGWIGRYRCKLCDGVGYKRRGVMNLYMCAALRANRQKCGNIAVVVKADKARNRCKEHKIDE